MSQWLRDFREMLLDAQEVPIELMGGISFYFPERNLGQE